MEKDIDYEISLFINSFMKLIGSYDKEISEGDSRRIFDKHGFKKDAISYINMTMAKAKLMKEMLLMLIVKDTTGYDELVYKTKIGSSIQITEVVDVLFDEQEPKFVVDKYWENNPNKKTNYKMSSEELKATFK